MTVNLQNAFINYFTHIWYLFVGIKMDEKKEAIKEKKAKKHASGKKVKKHVDADAQEHHKKAAHHIKEDVQEHHKKTTQNKIAIPKELAGVILVLAVFAIFAFYMNGDNTVPSTATTTTTVFASKGGAVISGDTVLVDYIGMFENGSVFDTSDKPTAEKAGIVNPLRNYTPIEFKVGDGQLIPGFEKALIGMKAGQDKEVLVPASEGYGGYNEKLVQFVKRIQRSPTVHNVSKEGFTQEIGQEAEVGLKMKLPDKEGFELPWDIEVQAVYNDTVTFKYLPGAKATIDTVFGPAEVYGEGDEIIIAVNAKKGQRILTLDGPAEVVNVDDENIVVDFNHPLAGKNLRFWIKLVDIKAA